MLKKLLYTLAVLSLSVTAIDAQEIVKLNFSAKPTWTSGSRNSGGDGNGRLIDVDKDGDYDLVTSLPNPRRWVLFKNVDGTLEQEPSWESKTTTDCDHISVLDFNGDGWMDLAGTHESHCTLYLNGGKSKPGFTSEPTWKTSIVTDANQIDFGDFDGDGDLDMLMASGLPFYGLAIFENKDGLPSPTPTARVGGRDYSETAIFADVDSDKDLDIIAAYGKKGTVYIYRNENGKFDKGTQIFSDDKVRWCQRIYCIDLDKDGSKEIFCARGPWGPPGASIALTQADSSRKWSVIWRSGPQTGYHGLDFQDVDRDGDLDVAAADWSGRRVAIYLQTKAKLPTEPSWSAPTNGPAHEVKFGDIDGDGDLDIAVGGVVQAQVFTNLSK